MGARQRVGAAQQPGAQQPGAQQPVVQQQAAQQPVAQQLVAQQLVARVERLALAESDDTAKRPTSARAARSQRSVCGLQPFERPSLRMKGRM